MKISIAFERASHVNSGTSVDPEELPWPETEGRVMRHRLLHLESDPRGEITHYGGLVLAQQFVRRFRVAQRLDGVLSLFKRHAPYHESDHILALAYTLYADGRCLEDQAVLQGSEAVRRLVGACRIPDPTTAGDFLRRFKTVHEVEQLCGVIDEVQEAVWSKLARTVAGAEKSRSLRWSISTGTSSLFMEYRKKEPILATIGVGRISHWWFRLAAAGNASR